MGDLNEIRDNADNIERAEHIIEETKVRYAIPTIFSKSDWVSLGMWPVEIEEQSNARTGKIDWYIVQGAEVELINKTLRFKIDYAPNFGLPHGPISTANLTTSIGQTAKLKISLDGNNIADIQASNHKELEWILKLMS